MKANTSLPGKAEWFLRDLAPPDVLSGLVQTLAIPPSLANVLYARGLEKDAWEHLNPPLTLSQIPDLTAAAERLDFAIKNGLRIRIHGDYDADGISGTAVLTLGLRALGANVSPFIPNRLTDGYGIHMDRVKEHREACDLFLSVDCGISNLQEIEALQNAGVEVIVSDHHQLGSRLPNCLIIHPSLSPLAQKGLPELTGAGVAYHLLWALHERLDLAPPVEFSDLATIGTIADVAPLMGENRALIQEGLRRMSTSRWPGLRALVKQIKHAPTARDVAFIIAPRLNAAGRLGEAEAGLELLMTASERKAQELSVYLNARNIQRRQIQDDMFQDALSKVDAEAPAIVLSDSDWHPGVMGIVASKLLERYYKPVFIMAKGKGSVRSTLGISAVEALQAAKDSLLRFGGHSQAAGFSLEEDEFANFRHQIYQFIEKQDKPKRIFKVDGCLFSSGINADLYKAISSLEPYGEGHPPPLFVLTDKLVHAQAVGKNKQTLQLRIAGIKGVAWQKGDMAKDLEIDQPISALIQLKENDWKGQRNLEFIAEDLRSFNHLKFQDVEAVRTIHRCAPPDNVQRFQSFEQLTPKEPLWIRGFPLQTNLLSATSPISQFLELPCELYFDLDDQTIEHMHNSILSYPCLQDLRQAYVDLRHGKSLKSSTQKNELILTVLKELGLLNAQGRPLTGQKRNPYESESLVKAMIEQYKLQSFLNAYLYFDEPSFAKALTVLFRDTR